METRANHLWVGAVTLVLLAGLAAFIVWLAQFGQGERKEFDILFQQSVDGLARGSQVTFAGVPVGQVDTIRIYEENPDFVQVRITVDDEVPILVGTTATIQGSFTGGLDHPARRRAARATADHLRDHRLPGRRSGDPAQGGRVRRAAVQRPGAA